MENVERNRASFARRATQTAVAVIAMAGAIAPSVASAEVEPHVAATHVDMLAPNSHWQLAGVTPNLDRHRLAVRHTDLGIVKQNGAPSQINRPVNLYGSYIKTHGAFSVTTTVSSIRGEADISLYAKPPIVEDEWRAEQGTVDMKIKGDTFTATVSDQEEGKNAHALQAKIKRSSRHSVKVTDKKGELSFKVDGRPVKKTLEDDGIFRSGNVYLGFDAQTPGGHFVVNRLVADGEARGSVNKGDSRSTKINRVPGGFAELAKNRRPGFVIGAAVALGPIVSDSNYRAALGNYNAISIENAGKTQNIEPQPGRFNFKEMDAIVGLANQNHLRVHGHSVVFGEANPGWLRSMAKSHPNKMAKQEANLVSTWGSHYNGKINSADVINEPLADDGEASIGKFKLRKNIWSNSIGEKYVENAIRVFQRVAPNVKVVINDYGMEAASGDKKFGRMVSLVKSLLGKGLRVDMVGFQSHFDETDTIKNNTRISVPKLRSRIQELAKLGVGSRISELDVSDPRQYGAYEDAVEACLAEPACEGVTTWGISNKYSSGSDLEPDGFVSTYDGLPWSDRWKALPPVAYIKRALSRR